MGKKEAKTAGSGPAKSERKACIECKQETVTMPVKRIKANGSSRMVALCRNCLQG